MDEAFLGSLVSSLPDAVISINRASVIVHANEAAFQLFGFARENFIGQSLADTIIPRDLGPQHMRGMANFAATGYGPVIGRRIDINACDYTGRRFPIELCVFLDRDRPGEIFHATIRETTERTVRDAVVSAERERLRQTLDATADAWWDCTVGGTTRFSESTAQVLGCPQTELPSCAPSILPSIHSDDIRRVDEAWRAHLDGHSAVFIGDAAERDAALIAEAGGGQWVTRTPPPLAPALARIAGIRAARGEAGRPHQLTPIYVRRPDVEIERERRERP